MTKKKHTMEGDYDITVSNSNLSMTYPGALLLANLQLVEGFPSPLTAERAPIDICIDLPGLKNGNHCIVEKPAYSSVNDAIAQLLENWYVKNEQGYEVPVKLQYKSSILYDEKAMALKFGCDVEFMRQKLGIDFEMIKNQKRSAYLMEFKQIFYTVSIDSPKNPADVFGDTVTWEEISRKINEENPPVYVQNVQYGREILLLLESNMDSESLSAMIEGNFSWNNGKLSVNGKIDFNELAKKLKATVYIVGGTPSKIDFGSDLVSQINQLIAENTKLVKKCYTVAFLKGNRIGNVYGKTEYVTSESKSFSSGAIELEHNGAYVARFYVSWDLIDGFDELGNEKLNHKSWEGNGQNKTAGFRTIIQLPENAKNIQVKAEGATGLVWDKWHTSVNTPPMTLVQKRKIFISGTTLNQKGEIEPQL